MALFCINRTLAANLKKAAQAGEINIKKMYDMTSEQRRELFKSYTDEETATQINAGFEKAMVSNEITSLKKWAEATFDSKPKQAANYKNVVDKINALEKIGVLNQAGREQYYQDLIATSLGAVVTAEEAKTITEKANRMEELYKEKSEFNTPTMEYFEAKKDMDNYLSSLTPSSRLKILLSTVRRGALLFSLKSPILNVVSNTGIGMLEGLTRRIASGQVTGENTDYAVEYAKYANQVFSKTGYDITRMLTLDTTRKTLGEDSINTQGPGAIRKVGRAVEDVVFKHMLSAPDVFFSSIHFADAANLASTKIAKAEGLEGEALKSRALEIFKDSTSINPETKEGERVRNFAQSQAFYATFTNDSFAADVALDVRKVLNRATGDFRAGDQLMPFVKTPANVVSAGLDYFGIGAIDGVLSLREAMDAAKEGRYEPLTEAVQNIARAGLGISIATLLASFFEPDDFIGGLPTSPKEKKLLELKGAVPYSVRIGDKWVSLEYFNVISSPLIGMLNAKKFKGDLGKQAFAYLKSSVQLASEIPGYDTVKGIYDNFSDIDKEEYAMSDAMVMVSNYVGDYIKSIVLPGISGDIAKALDPYERDVEYNDPIAKFKSAVPKLRETLPVKKDTLQDPIKTQPVWSQLLFGSRVKTVRETALTKELDRLDKEGYLPSITNVEDTNQSMKNLRGQIGEQKFQEALAFYGETLKSRLVLLTENPSYNKLDDEKKQDFINKIKNTAVKQTLNKYGYRKEVSSSAR